MPRPGPRGSRWPERAIALAAMVSGCAGAAPPEPQGELRGRLVAGVGGPGASGLRWVCARPAAAAARPAPLPTLVWRRAANAFAPTLLVARAGQAIRLVNDEDVCHRFFTAQVPNAFDQGLLRPGEATTLRFEHPGLVHVYCALHGGRQGSVLVAATPHVSQVAPSGEFVLTGLPPGPCVLEVWSESAAPWSVPVQVPRGGAQVVAIPTSGLATEPGR